MRLDPTSFSYDEKERKGSLLTIQKMMFRIVEPTCTRTMKGLGCSKEGNEARMSKKDHWIQPLISNGQHFQIKVIGMIQHRICLCELVIGKTDNSKVKRK